MNRWECKILFQNQAETELHKAQVQASRSAKQLEEAIDTFEQKKLTDLKVWITSYFVYSSEERFHKKINRFSLLSLLMCGQGVKVCDVGYQVQTTWIKKSVVFQ